MFNKKRISKVRGSQLHPVHNLCSETAEGLASGAWSDRWVSNDEIERKGEFDVDGVTVAFRAVIKLGMVSPAQA